MPDNFGNNKTFFDRNQQQAENILGKGLPSNVSAEKAVLSAILLNDENITLVSDVLQPSDFYNKQHQIIFEAMIELAQENKNIDLVVLQDFLEQKKQLESSGGIIYLMELQEDIPAIGLISQHARIVKDKSILRELIYSATDIISSCYGQDVDKVDEVLDEAQKKIYQISNNLTAQNFIKLDVLLKQTFQKIVKIKSQKEGVTGVPSGFRPFDKLTSGMQKSDLLILAARPSMGKTAMALNIALNAWRHGSSVGVFSLEMSSEQLVLRMLSSETHVPHQKIRNAAISSEEWMALTNGAAKLAEAKFFIDDTPSLSIMELRAKARKLKAKEDVQLLVVDYLQLISAHGRYENRTQEISAISRSLKALAKELDIPILALSQLSRNLESRMDKRPMLSDLRDSGAIEQDGDVIFFIYRDVIYNPDTDYPDEAEIIVGKQRNGPTGTFNVKFLGEITRFDDLPRG